MLLLDSDVEDDGEISSKGKLLSMENGFI